MAIDRDGVDAGNLRHAWYAIAILTLANMSGFIDRQILSLLVEPIKRDLHISDTSVSLLMGIGFAAFYSVLGIPIGRLVDSGSRRTIVAVGVGLWSLMTSLSGVARTFTQLLLSRLGVGVGEATLGPSAVSMISDLFPRRMLGFAMAVFTTGTFLGSGMGYVIGAYVVTAMDRPGVITLPFFGDIFPWQTVFFMVGLPGIVIAALAMTMREPARPAGTINRIAFGDVLHYMRQHLRTTVAVVLGFSCSATVNYGIGAWMATFFVRTHGYTILQAGALQGIMTLIVGPIGAVAGGRLTDSMARRGMSDAPLRVGMFAALGMILTAGVYPLVSSGNIAAALILPVNFFAAMPWGAASAAIAEMLPARMRGQGTAIYQLVLNLLSALLGPTSVALLTDSVFHDPLAVRWSLSIVTVVGMTCTIAFLAWGRGAYRVTVAGADSRG